MEKILAYHSIGGNSTREAGAELYAVSVENFREQMEYIAAYAARITHYALRITKIELTFDDGLIDNYTKAYPILKEFGLKAYFFIIPLKVGMPGYMHWEQLKALKDAGMTIGSHGMTHRILTELSEKELADEFKTSKKILEENLKVKIEHLSIPRGFSNARILTQASAAGYRAVFTSSAGDKGGFAHGRIPVKASWKLDKFIKVVNNGYSLSDKTGIFFKQASQRILGAKNYDRLRTVILEKRDKNIR